MSDNLDFKGKTLLVVDTGPQKKKFIFQKLKKMGLRIIVLNKEKNWAEPYVDKWIVADNYNHSEALVGVSSFIKNNPRIKIDGVLTFWEDHVLLTSKIVDKFNLAGISYSIAKKVRNKYKFREFCRENGLPAPKHKIITSIKDLYYVSKHFTFPLVVKPAFGADSVYVIKVDNIAELTEAFWYIKNNISPDNEETSSLADGLDIFVEEYIDGDEVDIDLIIQNGKIKFYSIADNYNKNRAQFFVDSGQAIPSSLPHNDQQALISLAEETLEKLNIQNGCIHFEAKSTKNGPVPIEVNLRMGGDYVYSYIKGTWGVDLIEQSAKVALGDYIKIQKPEHPLKYIIGWDVHPLSSGILVELDIPNALKEKNYLEDINFYKEIGDSILLPPDGYELLGWLTVSGDNLLDAQDNLREALSLIKYKVVEFNEDSSVGKTSRQNRFSGATLKQDLILQVTKRERVRRSTLQNQRSLFIGICSNSKTNLSNSKKITNPTIYIEKELKNKGYKTTNIYFSNIFQTINELRKGRIDLMYPIFSEIDDIRYAHPQFLAILETLHIPFVGTSSINTGLNLDRIRTKKILEFHHIPTPPWDYLFSLQDTIRDNIQYPFIIKPGYKTSYVSPKEYIVVDGKKNLEKSLRKAEDKFSVPFLLEEYVEGSEYVVPILGTEKNNIQVLPLVKIIKNTTQLAYSYQCPPKNLSQKQESLITEIALDAYRILHLRDYGSVRVIVDKEGNPYVLSIETHPSLLPTEFFCKAAKLMKFNHKDLLEEIIRLTIQRYKEQKDPIDYL